MIFCGNDIFHVRFQIHVHRIVYVFVIILESVGSTVIYLASFPILVSCIFSLFTIFSLTGGLSF